MLSKKLKVLYATNKKLFINIVFSYVIKGFALLLGFLVMPFYIKYFNNDYALGFWFTILSILNWVINLDFGIGNGLRNKLVEPISKNNKEKIRELISSAYIILSILTAVLTIIGVVAIFLINWNNFLNIDTVIAPNAVLRKTVLMLFIGIMFNFLIKIVFSILYAYENTFLSNLSGLIASLTMFAFVIVFKASSVESGLFNLALVNIIAINLPVIIVTVMLFTKKLRFAIPRIKFYSRKTAMDILKLSGMFFWIQLVLIVITSTNQMFISRYYGSDNVVDYQAYYKFFSMFTMLFSLLSTPIWSSVSLAKEKKDYLWIFKTYKILVTLTLVLLILMLPLLFLMQYIFDLWLGNNVMIANKAITLIFIIEVFMMVSILAVTAIANGMNILRPQLVMNTISSVLKVLLIVILNRYYSSWVFIVIVNIAVLVPNVIIQHVSVLKILNIEVKKENNYIKSS